MKGIRKLDNYVRKVKADFERRHAPETTREDIEAWDIDKERVQDAYNEHKQVERVIATKEDEETEEVMYLVKCEYSTPSKRSA